MQTPSFLDRELLTLTTALLPEESRQEEAQVAEALARVVWSHITEPGDMCAGHLIAELGAVDALTALFVRSRAAESPVDAHTLTTAEDILQRYVHRGAAHGPGAWTNRISREAIHTGLRIAAQNHIRVLTPQSKHWPLGFADLQAAAPHCLWALGGTAALASESVGIVGSRAVTSYGEEVTSLFAEQAVQYGHTVVSGAAYGVDAIAHRTAIAAGGHTIAYVAGGVNRAYPRAHTQLFEHISRNGAVVSENPPDTTPAKWRFLQRNRLIAAHAEATVLTAAGVRSGAVNTAGHAAALDRPLGAVPGNITGTSNSGCHRVIREYDARPLFHQRELADLLPCMDTTLFDETKLQSSVCDRSMAQIKGIHMRVRDALLLRTNRTLQQIITVSGVDEADAKEALAELELLGEITLSVRQTDGQKSWRLASPTG